MIELLQEIESQVVRWSGEKHDNADVLCPQIKKIDCLPAGRRVSGNEYNSQANNMKTAKTKLREFDVFLLTISEPPGESVASVGLNFSCDELET